jgi:hypothetical protein
VGCSPVESTGLGTSAIDRERIAELTEREMAGMRERTRLRG